MLLFLINQFELDVSGRKNTDVISPLWYIVSGDIKFNSLIAGDDDFSVLLKVISARFP